LTGIFPDARDRLTKRDLSHFEFSKGGHYEVSNKAANQLWRYLGTAALGIIPGAALD
jgi:hypothetical protein